MNLETAIPSPAPQLGASSVEVLNERVRAIHDEIRAYFPFVVRLSVALYDPATDELKTFLYSPAGATPLRAYSTQLAGAGWLDVLRRDRRARVIDDLAAVDLGNQVHSRKIREGAYRASYTVPIYDGETLLGFVFFNADAPAVFTPRVTHQLDLFVRIVSLMVANTLRTAATLVGSVHLLREVSRFRDDETADHLSRMAYFSQLIARRLAPRFGRDDEWIEHVRLFAPLHDVGKIGTPDAILFKPAGLTDAEFEVMKEHAPRGEAILRGLVTQLGLEQVPYVASLLAIARHHHECWDGTGYPDGLARERIPLEARIVKVADVFDALTSRRVYKPAWPIEDAVTYLRQGQGSRFDPDAVDALLDQLPAARGYIARFREGSTEAA